MSLAIEYQLKRRSAATLELGYRHADPVDKGRGLASYGPRTNNNKSPKAGRCI